MCSKKSPEASEEARPGRLSPRWLRGEHKTGLRGHPACTAILLLQEHCRSTERLACSTAGSGGLSLPVRLSKTPCLASSGGMEDQREAGLPALLRRGPWASDQAPPKAPECGATEHSAGGDRTEPDLEHGLRVGRGRLGPSVPGANFSGSLLVE